MKPGIFSIASPDYHRDEVGCDEPTLSASIASILLRDSPKHAHAAHPKLGGHPLEDSETFDLGTAAHSYILEGTEERFAIVQFDDWRTKAAKLERESARAEGKTPMLARHLDSVRNMSSAIRNQLAEFSDNPGPLTKGKAEQVLIWEDEGIWCRARLDWLHDDLSTIDDLKTGAVSAKPDNWTRTMYGAGKDIQAAFYIRGLQRITGKEALFRFIVAENKYPYATSVISLGPEALAHAHDQVEQAIQLWSRCMVHHNWPGYPIRTCYVEPPAWALSQWLEQEAVNEL